MSVGTFVVGPSSVKDYYPSDSNDLAWWKCDDAIGSSVITNYGSAGAGANFTALSSVALGAGGPAFGLKAAYMSGSGFARTPTGVVEPSGSFTVSMYFQILQNVDTWNWLLCKWNSNVFSGRNIVIFRQDSPPSGVYRSNVINGGVFAGANFAFNDVETSWNHTGVSYDSATGEVAVYLNGVQVISGVAAWGSGPITWNGGFWCVGNGGIGGGDGAYRCAFSDIRVADVVRSPSWFELMWAHIN